MDWPKICLFVIFSFLYQKNLVKADHTLKLPVVHVNDFHAKFEEIGNGAGSCKSTSCIGGFSRLYTEIKTLLAENPNAVLLNGGDNFQGTLYYSIGKWNITQEFMNKLPFDAIVLGNHEFDDGIEGVVPFIKSLKAPVVCSNIDDRLEPQFQGIYSKSTIIERGGRKIGIIGVIISTTNEISNTGKLAFYQESASVNAEAERLVREEGVFTNIVLSHVGYDIDKAIAANASSKIGLIVGGHSHTFLFTGDNPPGPDTAGGPYPTIVTSKTGNKVLVVQASSYTKYLGNITVYYDENGEIVDYNGAPIFLDTDIPQDKDINTALAPWKDLVDAQGSVIVGSSLVTLSNSACYHQECTLGNFVSDAYVYSYTENVQSGEWTRASIAIINPGGLRTNIRIGDITYNDLKNAQPFANTVDVGDLQGKYLKELFEQCAQENYTNGRMFSDLKLLHVSGVHIVYNLTRPVGDRVQDIKVRCRKCNIPVYDELDLEAIYSIAVPSFLRDGGDGFTALSNNIKNVVVGQLDTDVFMKYLQNRSPVFSEEEGRITVIANYVVSSYGYQ